MMNADDVLYAGIYMLVDPMSHHQKKRSIFHTSLLKERRKCYAISIFLSKEMWVPRITLSIGSIATHNHTYTHYML
jgi:hypothetical protein